MREQDDEAIEGAREGHQQILDHIAARTSREKGAAPVRRHGDVVVGPDVDKDGVPMGRPAPGTHHVAGVRTYGKGESGRGGPENVRREAPRATRREVGVIRDVKPFVKITWLTVVDPHKWWAYPQARNKPHTGQTAVPPPGHSTYSKGPRNAPGARQGFQGGVAAAGVEEGSLPRLTRDRVDAACVPVRGGGVASSHPIIRRRTNRPAPR